MFIISDFAAAEKSCSDINPERGYSMVLQVFFGETILVDNHVENGRSSICAFGARFATVLKLSCSLPFLTNKVVLITCFFSKNGSLSFFLANFVFVSINFLFPSQKNLLI